MRGVSCNQIRLYCLHENWTYDLLYMPKCVRGQKYFYKLADPEVGALCQDTQLESATA